MSNGFYGDPPTHPLALDDVERMASLRLRALCQALQAQSPKSTSSSSGNGTVEREQLDADAELDRNSHYVLRLAFCTYVRPIAALVLCHCGSDFLRLLYRAPDDWDWFVQAEAALFKSRLISSKPNRSVQLLLHEGIAYERCSMHEAAFSLYDQDWLRSIKTSKDDALLYRVPFSHASGLLRHRRTLIKQGFCFVSLRDMLYIAAHHFRWALLQQLTAFHRAIPAKREELKRVQPIFDRIFAQLQVHTTDRTSFSSNADELPRITPQDIDYVAERHFPLCMRHLHRKLRANHHLKYDGRVQYRLFLKGLGFSVHETMTFFRTEFIQTIPTARFDKEYAYHIRHSYGLEGAHKDYRPLSCEQIIEGSAPRQGQFHGCPFKHWDSAALRQELYRDGRVQPDTADRIVIQAENGGYQSACQALLVASHPPSASACLDLQLHPNAYVEASRLATHHENRM